MQPVDFDEILELILKRDSRYQREAYYFVREALDFTQKLISQSQKSRVRHVTGQELLDGIRRYALEQYGPMTHSLLAEWGIHRCEDFGEIVFVLVEANVLAKTDQDHRDDFKGGYDFFEAFTKPFLPSSKLSEKVSSSGKQG